MFSRRFLRIKIIKALYAYHKSESDKLDLAEKNLMSSIDKSYDLYLKMLSLMPLVAKYAEERIEIAKNKKLPTYEDLNPNCKFINNRVIAQLAASHDLEVLVENKGLGWVKNPEIIKHLYNKLINSEYYQAYMLNSPGEKESYKKDLHLVQDFYINTVQDDELMETLLEEESIQWADDLDYALIMAVRTLSDMRAKDTDIELLRKYKNEEDKEFVQKLFRSAILNYNAHLNYIEQYTKNWDVERIAFMDNLIMVAAMAELIEFDSIPVKVTFDEYIEIAKHYSTAGSGTFINGILDKVANSLTKEGKITKSGRGLIGA